MLVAGSQHPFHHLCSPNLIELQGGMNERFDGLLVEKREVEESKRFAGM